MFTGYLSYIYALNKYGCQISESCIANSVTKTSASNLLLLRSHWYGFVKHILPDITRQSSWGEMGAGKSQGLWITESADCLQATKMLVLSTELSTLLLCKVVGVLHCALHDTVNIDGLLCNLQCVLVCLPVSVSTEQVYSEDQFLPATQININYLYKCKKLTNYNLHRQNHIAITWGI